jgi:hypothetical protein
MHNNITPTSEAGNLSSPLTVHRNKSNINHLSATMLELIRSSPTASNQHKPEQHDNQPHASHCPISSRERTLQPTTPTYHRHIIDASHRGTQQYNHPPVLTSSFIEVYTFFIIPTALLDQWKLVGVLSTCHSSMA